MPLNEVGFHVISVRGSHLKDEIRLVHCWLIQWSKPKDSFTWSMINPRSLPAFIFIGTRGSALSLQIYSVSRWWLRNVKYECNLDCGMPYSDLNTRDTNSSGNPSFFGSLICTSHSKSVRDWIHAFVLSRVYDLKLGVEASTDVSLSWK